MTPPDNNSRALSLPAASSPADLARDLLARSAGSPALARRHLLLFLTAAIAEIDNLPTTLPSYNRILKERDDLKAQLAAAPDLTQLQAAVEELRAAIPGTPYFAQALDATMDALDALFPKDDIP